MKMTKNITVLCCAWLYGWALVGCASDQTEFVEHKKNGVVLSKTEDINNILSYYLDSLANWNEAVVCSYELGKRYTTERLLEKWGEVIRFIGRDSYTTVGR